MQDEAERKLWQKHGVDLIPDLAFWLGEFEQHDDKERVDEATEAWHTDFDGERQESPASSSMMRSAGSPGDSASSFCASTVTPGC